MKKLFVLLFLLISWKIGFSQENRMVRFEDLKLHEGRENCYTSEWLGKERKVVLVKEETELYKLIITYTGESEFEALSDFYGILNHFKDNPMWRVSEYLWIVYKEDMEIVVRLDILETKTEIINTKIEDRLIK